MQCEAVFHSTEITSNTQRRSFHRDLRNYITLYSNCGIGQWHHNRLCCCLYFACIVLRALKQELRASSRKPNPWYIVHDTWYIAYRWKYSPSDMTPLLSNNVYVNINGIIIVILYAIFKTRRRQHSEAWWPNDYSTSVSGSGGPGSDPNAVAWL